MRNHAAGSGVNEQRLAAMMHCRRDDLSELGAEPFSSERRFYEGYEWALNLYPTAGDAIGHLGRELDKLATALDTWQLAECQKNAYLLACGLLNSIDEYLRGPALRIPARFSTAKLARAAAHSVELLAMRPRSRAKTIRWRTDFFEALKEFLKAFISGLDDNVIAAGCELRKVLNARLPPELLNGRVGAPTAYSRIDLTHHDCIALAERFRLLQSDFMQPVVCLGLRTSGSYFAPLFAAYLESKGYADIQTLTIEPNKGVGFSEMRRLKLFARRRYSVLIIDDPPHTNRTILAALGATKYAGFPADLTTIVAATHAANPYWSRRLPRDNVISLAPEQWHKRELLDATNIRKRLAEYFRACGLDEVSVAPRPTCEQAGGELHASVDDPRSRRLKQVYEVKARSPKGGRHTTHVLAKSVGWGWLSYRAYLIGTRLSGRVPRVIGLRDGILYTEWLPERSLSAPDKRSEIISSAASYIATRFKTLKIDSQRGDFGRYNNGVQLLQKSLSRSYGRILLPKLVQPWLGQRLLNSLGGPSTLIDGDMHPSKWVVTRESCLKAGFEHHGMGKAGLNVTDPAYDLADLIFSLELSRDEERKIIQDYVAETEDYQVARRLFLNKLLAGLWRMKQAQDLLFSSSRTREAQQTLHSEFMRAWNFLTTEAARHCGSLCSHSRESRWRTPIVFLDVDGVIDNRLFGFPCTTAAGIAAISSLHAHGISVALNTARSTAEVKAYCEAYGLAGGVGEHGAWLYDAINNRENILISEGAQHQLQQLRERLRSIPGIFMDERHRYSIRTFAYRDKPVGVLRTLADMTRYSQVGDGALAPVSTQLMHDLLEDMRLDRLTFHHTSIDTAVVAKEVDKGRGLIALRNWVADADCETIAVGDGASDLAMFEVASRSFGPANLSSGHYAWLFGCQLASSSNQRAFLEIVDRILHGGGDGCRICYASRRRDDSRDGLLFELLRAADHHPLRRIAASALRGGAYKAFIR